MQSDEFLGSLLNTAIWLGDINTVKTLPGSGANPKILTRVFWRLDLNMPDRHGLTVLDIVSSSLMLNEETVIL
jgi:hypothetical protein